MRNIQKPYAARQVTIIGSLTPHAVRLPDSLAQFISGFGQFLNRRVGWRAVVPITSSQRQLRARRLHAAAPGLT
ncbi:hypothetical protein C5748_10865 [Phyllobacterium phragmitis]|uniref:Uncharacterized protein n=1 Tax=Phyllobacterium phragmitis TaxID=2670329 RepID=A0A2S9IT76_9HYPH|nr:hypothetical protein C5748_10865 [Phyllobacterium phragmitis]